MAMPELRPNASLPSNSIAKFKLLLRSFGKGCEGSRPIGVKIGITSLKKYCRIQARNSSLQSLRRIKTIPSFSSAGKTISFIKAYCRVTKAWAASDSRANAWRGVMPSGRTRSGRKAASSRNHATLTSNNSSRLDETIHKKRRRSSKGTAGSSACASTRRLNSIKPISRFSSKSAAGVVIRLASKSVNKNARDQQETGADNSYAFGGTKPDTASAP